MSKYKRKFEQKFIINPESFQLLLMPLRDYFNPPPNCLIDRFFRDYKSTHIFKFVVNHRLHRVLTLVTYKIAYWLVFKVVNRLELRDVHNILPKQKDYKGEPFIIIENHSANLDVVMHNSIWAHFGYLCHAFIAGFGYPQNLKHIAGIMQMGESIPRYGNGKANVNRMVRRLKQGDIVNLYPAGNYPSGPFANSGFVQEAFSGCTRVAYQYWKQTGKKLKIQPVCSLGGNIAYPPRIRPERISPNFNCKIIVKFGKPFVVDFSDELTYEEIQEKTTEIQMKIAEIWGQKKLIPNYSKIRQRKSNGGAGKPRAYQTHVKIKKKKKKKPKPASIQKSK